MQLLLRLVLLLVTLALVSTTSILTAGAALPFFLFGALISLIANGKGRGGFIWFWYGSILTVLSLIHVLLVSRVKLKEG